MSKKGRVLLELKNNIAVKLIMDDQWTGWLTKVVSKTLKSSGYTALGDILDASGQGVSS